MYELHFSVLLNTLTRGKNELHITDLHSCMTYNSCVNYTNSAMQMTHIAHEKVCILHCS